MTLSLCFSHSGSGGVVSRPTLFMTSKVHRKKDHTTRTFSLFFSTFTTPTTTSERDNKREQNMCSKEEVEEQEGGGGGREE